MGAFKMEKWTYLVVFDTDILLRFEGQVTELEQLWVELQVSELEHLLDFNR